MQNAPTAAKLVIVVTPIVGESLAAANLALTSVPVRPGIESVIVSKKKTPESGKVVVIVKLRCEPSEERHPVPAEGEFLSNWAVRPVHVLHLPFRGTLKPLPIRI